MTVAPDSTSGRAVDASAGRIASASFAALSALRRKRFFHPHGTTFTAVLDTAPVAGRQPWGARLLDVAGRYDTVVRLSRGAGLPEPLPDLLGLAVRVTGAGAEGGPADLLFATVAGAAPVFRQVLAPARTHAEFHSTIAPYRTGSGRVVLLGARALATARNGAPLRFELAVAGPTGAWEPFGVLRIQARRPAREGERIGFDPYHAAPDLRPVGLLNALRRRAYAGSQSGRSLTGAVVPSDLPAQPGSVPVTSATSPRSISG